MILNRVFINFVQQKVPKKHFPDSYQQIQLIVGQNGHGKKDHDKMDTDNMATDKMVKKEDKMATDKMVKHFTVLKYIS